MTLIFAHARITHRLVRFVFRNCQWNTAKLDAVLTDWEKAIEAADESKLSAWYSDIAHMSTHNACHTGQIIYIRKLQGSWDASKGVK